MPRASQYLLEGYTYHLTHRCHNRSFLLRFARDRDVYREWLREGVRRHGVLIYGFYVTNNHVHLVVHVDRIESVSSLMHLAAGATAKQYNLRKGHLGSLWEHPFQCTMVEDGRHLFNCLCYVDLNMVRTGVVSHPREWRWCGYDELTGTRARCRLLQPDRLLESLGMSGLREFHERYTEAVEERIAARQMVREAHWTESLAVGSRDFVENARKLHKRRWKFEITEASKKTSETWIIKERSTAYKTV